MDNNHSESVDKLIPATIAARKKFKTIIFDKSGARNKYASLSAILDATKDGLMENELDIFFSEYKDADGSFVLETKLMHSSNQWKRTVAPIIIDKNLKISEQQQYGVGLSYAKRYSLQTILGVYGDDADWDNIDAHYHKETENKQRIKYNLTNEQAQEILDTFDKKAIDQLKRDLKINDLREMSTDAYNTLMQ